MVGIENECGKERGVVRHMPKSKDRAPETNRANEIFKHSGMEMGVCHNGFCGRIS